MGNSLKCIIKLHLILLEHRSRVTQLGLKLKIIDSFGYKQYINWINFGGYTINWGYTIKSSKGNREQKIQSESPNSYTINIFVQCIKPAFIQGRAVISAAIGFQISPGFKTSSLLTLLCMDIQLHLVTINMWLLWGFSTVGIELSSWIYDAREIVNDTIKVINRFYRLF